MGGINLFLNGMSAHRAYYFLECVFRFIVCYTSLCKNNSHNDNILPS